MAAVLKGFAKSKSDPKTTTTSSPLGKLSLEEIEAGQDADDVAVDEALRQLMHQHEILTKDKRKIEAFYEEMANQAEVQRQTIEALQKKNATLTSLAQDLGKQKSEISLEVTQLRERLNSQPRIESRRESLSWSRPNNNASNDEDDWGDEFKSLSPEGQQRIFHLQGRVTELEEELQFSQSIERQSKSEISRLQVLITQLENDLEDSGGPQPRHRAPHESHSGNGHLVPERFVKIQINGEDCTDACLAPRIDRDGSEAPPLCSQAFRYEEEIRHLSELLEEARQQLKDMEGELQSSHETPEQRSTDQSIGSEIGNGLGGMTFDEQVLILEQRNELKLANDTLTDELSMLKDDFAELDRKYTSALQYYRYRDGLILQILERKTHLSVNKKEKLIAILANPVVDF